MGDMRALKGESVEVIMQSLETLLLEAKKNFVSISWIRKNKRSLYNALFSNLDDGFVKIYVEVIRSKLSSEAASKLCFDFFEAKLESDKLAKIKELDELLKKKKPKKFGSRYIRSIDRNLFNFLNKNFRDSKGFIDWGFIVAGLSEELRPRFSYPVRHQRSFPEKIYEDELEIEVEIGENIEYMYTFFRANRGEEWEKRNAICATLARLAKKGNMAAEKRLIDLMSFLADKWVENIAAFKSFRYYQDEGRETIRRCIYNYKGGGPFVGYVFKSLKMATLSLNCVREAEFNDEIKYSRCEL